MTTLIGILVILAILAFGLLLVRLKTMDDKDLYMSEEWIREQRRKGGHLKA